MFTVLTITFEWKRIWRWGLNFLESRHPELWFEQKVWTFSIQNKWVIVIWIWPINLVKIGIPPYAPIEGRGHKIGSLTFCWQIQSWNIFPTSGDQSLQYQITGKKWWSKGLVQGSIGLELELLSFFSTIIGLKYIFVINCE